MKKPRFTLASMSCNLEAFCALKVVPLPASAEDFPLDTTNDLRRAIREVAKANDERLIFEELPLDLSPLGHENLFSAINSPTVATGEDAWDEMFSNDPKATLEASQKEEEYWSILGRRITAFFETPEGRIVADTLAEELFDFLISNFFHDGPIPDTLVERVVATELCWRAQARCTHQYKHPELYQVEASMCVEIIAKFDVNKKVVESTPLRIPATHTFEDFSALLCHQSGIPTAINADLWCYVNPMSDDVHDRNHFRSITAQNYKHLQRLLIDTPRMKGREVKLLLWHESQIEYVRRDDSGYLSPSAWDSEVIEDERQQILEELGGETEWMTKLRRLSHSREILTPVEEDREDDLGVIEVSQTPQRYRSHL